MKTKRTINLLVAVCLLAVGAPCIAGEAPKAAEPLKVETKSVSKLGTVRAVLSNGLTVLLKENHSAPAVHVRVVAKVGSVTEPTGG